MSTFNELIDFTRSTTGTYLDSVVYGDELVVNGDFATDSDWIKTGNLTAISNGTATIGETAGNGSIRQEDALITGKSYIVKFDITAVSSASALLAFRNDEVSSVNSAVISFGNSLSVATYSKVFVATGSIVNFTVGGGNTSLAIDNISVKEVIGGQVSGTPLLRTAAINEPRLEYDASGNPLGLLIEEARTNLFDYSEDYAPWSKSFLNLTEEGIAPDGTSSTKVTVSASTSVSYLYKATPISATNNTNSFYVKKGNNNIFWLYVLIGSRFGTAYFNIDDLTTQAVSGTLSTPSNLQIQDAGNGWYRISATFNVTSGQTSGVGIGLADAKGSTSVTSGKFGYVWGAQVETGSFPTSYIPTSGSAVTRAADFASLPVERFAYNQSKGSVVATGSTVSTVGAGKEMINLNDGTNSNYMQLNKTAFTNQTRARFFVITGNTTQAQIFSAVGSVSAGSVNKHAGAFQKNDFAFVFDGSLKGVDTVGEVPPVTTVTLGASATSAQQLNGHIKSVQYYPKRLSNEELELLTQPSASPTMNLTFDGQATSTLVEGLHD